MVLESFLFFKSIRESALLLFSFCFSLSVFSLLVANYIFPSEAGMVTLIFIAIVTSPFFLKFFQQEELKDEIEVSRKKHTNPIKRHWVMIKTYTIFFLGVLIALNFCYTFLPLNSEAVFKHQLDTLQSMSTSGFLTSDEIFSVILSNNLKVLFLCFILSFVFGIGAVFILSWNASIIAVFIGKYTREYVMQKTEIFSILYSYFNGLSIGIFSIVLHGVPEILSYFVAGISGGILSAGLVKEKIGSLAFHEVLKDSLFLMLFSIFLLFLAAVLEVML